MFEVCAPHSSFFAHVFEFCAPPHSPAPVVSLLSSSFPLWISFVVRAPGRNLLTNGFYVTDVQPARLADMRLKLSETRAYQKNAGLTVEYQLVKDPRM